MDFEYTEDQQLLMTSFEALLERFRDPPHGQHGYVAYSAELQDEIAQGGFLEIIDQPGFGLLDAALLVEAAASCAVSVELAASAMVGPLLGGAPAPVAVAWGLGKPVRYLPQARTVCVIDASGVSVGTVETGNMRAADSTAAYPMAVLTRLPDDARRLSDTDAQAVRRRALIGIAVEAAGLMRGAVDNTVRYVKDRQQFGQPLGHFQGVQHRLAECAQALRACRWLAFRAAFSDDLRDAAVACLQAQEVMRKIVFDCHQFSGAMGLTLEFPLHLWTYRLKVLQGEVGGRGATGSLVADNVWPQPQAEPAELAIVM